MVLAALLVYVQKRQPALGFDNRKAWAKAKALVAEKSVG